MMCRYDFRGFLTNGTQNSVLQQTFPGVQVHQARLRPAPRAPDPAPVERSARVNSTQHAIEGGHPIKPIEQMSCRQLAPCKRFNTGGMCVPCAEACEGCAQGFLDQFLSLTDNSSSPQTNITAVIYQMSGAAHRLLQRITLIKSMSIWRQRNRVAVVLRPQVTTAPCSPLNMRDVSIASQRCTECAVAAGGQQPFHVLVTGHSLGAGLAAIAAPYFALQWPGADVTSITFGAS